MFSNNLCICELGQKTNNGEFSSYGMFRVCRFYKPYYGGFCSEKAKFVDVLNGSEYLFWNDNDTPSYTISVRNVEPVNLKHLFVSKHKIRKILDEYNESCVQEVRDFILNHEKKQVNDNVD